MELNLFFGRVTYSIYYSDLTITLLRISPKTISETSCSRPYYFRPVIAASEMVRSGALTLCMLAVASLGFRSSKKARY